MSTWNNSKKTLQETYYVSHLSQITKSLLPSTVKMQTGEKINGPKMTSWKHSNFSGGHQEPGNPQADLLQEKLHPTRASAPFFLYTLYPSRLGSKVTPRKLPEALSWDQTSAWCPHGHWSVFHQEALSSLVHLLAGLPPNDGSRVL